MFTYYYLTLEPTRRQLVLLLRIDWHPLRSSAFFLAYSFGGGKHCGPSSTSLFSPIIVICWKFPKLFIKARLYQNAVAVMGLLNAAMLLAKNLRYHLISKSDLVIAVVLIVLPNSTEAVLLGAGIVLLLLVWALVRVVLQTFRSGTFVESQRKLLSLATRVTDSPLQLNVAIQPDGTVTTEQTNRLASTIQVAAIANRLLYLWAYKLQQYRKSSFVLVFNTISYLSLFLGISEPLRSSC